MGGHEWGDVIWGDMIGGQVRKMGSDIVDLAVNQLLDVPVRGTRRLRGTCRLEGRADLGDLPT